MQTRQDHALPLKLFAILLCGSSLLVGSPRSEAAGKEEKRQVSANIDNKPAGQYLMTITRQDDGTLIREGKAHINVRIYLVKYTYDYDGREVWHNGRLQQLVSQANDDGKRYQVSASA